jgi:hypothetical protein
MGEVEYRSRDISPKIARFHLDRIDMQIGDVDIPRPPALGQFTRIGRRRSVMEIVASAMWKRERRLSLADAC